MMRQNTNQEFLVFLAPISTILVLFILPHHAHLPPHLPYILILFRSRQRACTARVPKRNGHTDCVAEGTSLTGCT
jgi:hypothetical protein